MIPTFRLLLFLLLGALLVAGVALAPAPHQHGILGGLRPPHPNHFYYLLYLWVHRTCICHQEAILATAHALVTAIGGIRICFRMFGILHIEAV
jgi:hypothetical protein